MTLKIESLRTELQRVNQELADAVNAEPVELVHQSGETDSDSLFLYGIVGGKDVGKTTLINLLAGAKISIDTDILDEGTQIAVAYCHEADLNSLQSRLSAAIEDRIHYITHDRNVLRNVVLMDFPDFDSRFVQHREDVQLLAKHVQGLVWVVTPRKYGDHEFIDRLETVAQSNENYYIVLNKIDQLDGKVDLSSVRAEVLGYLEQECQQRSVPAPTPDRLMMISAQQPGKYDFGLLHDRLIRIHSPDEIALAKADNIRNEFEKNIGRIQAHYQLDTRIEEIDEILEWLQQSVHSQFSKSYYDWVLQRVQMLESLQRRISHGLFLQRVEGWPILRQLCFPFAGLVSFLAGRFAFHESGESDPKTTRELLRHEGKTATGRIQEISDQLQDYLPHSMEATALLEPAQQIENQFSSVLQKYEERVIDHIKEGIRRPGAIRRFFVYFPLVWFPFLQPTLLFLLEHEPEISLSNTAELIAFLVSLFGAGNLLQSLVFLVFFYLAWLLLLYAHGARRVAKEGEIEFQEIWYEEFLPWIYQELAKPFMQRRSEWIEYQTVLDRIANEIDTELNRITQKQY